MLAALCQMTWRPVPEDINLLTPCMVINLVPKFPTGCNLTPTITA